MTTLILVGILLPVLLLGALCVWLAVRLQRAERELWEYRHFDWYKAVRRQVRGTLESGIGIDPAECPSGALRVSEDDV